MIPDGCGMVWCDLKGNWEMNVFGDIGLGGTHLGQSSDFGFRTLQDDSGWVWDGLV